MKITIVMLLLLVVGCHDVVRDEAVYKTEVGFVGAVIAQETESLLYFVKTHCKCTDGKFVVPECEQAAKRTLVAKSRVQWHLDMMIYNARLAEDRPAIDPPQVPSSSTLCQ